MLMWESRCRCGSLNPSAALTAVRSSDLCSAYRLRKNLSARISECPDCFVSGSSPDISLQDLIVVIHEHAETRHFCIITRHRITFVLKDNSMKLSTQRRHKTHLFVDFLRQSCLQIRCSLSVLLMGHGSVCCMFLRLSPSWNGSPAGFYCRGRRRCSNQVHGVISMSVVIGPAG